MAFEFPIKDLGDLHYFLDIQESRMETGLHLSQTQYLYNLLHSSDLDNLKPSVTPMVANLDLCPQGNPIINAREYRRIVGSLQYITLMRSDVQLAVNHLSQSMASPEEIHWVVMKRVLCFLSGTPNHGNILRQMKERASWHFVMRIGGRHSLQEERNGFSYICRRDSCVQVCW